jgi:hypothetical protein
MADKPNFYTGWTEPESAANTDFQPKYPFNHVLQTESGHVFEMDDTRDRERVRLSHRSGTFIEMHPNGDEVHKVYGDGYEITIKDRNILVKGKMNITVEGDCVMHVMGDMIEQIDGNYEQYVKGNFTQVVEGITNMSTVQDMHLTAGAFAGGSLMISCGSHVHMNSDLTVDGEIQAAKITSSTRVDAGTGMRAGPLGFVTTTGGVAVGIPAAVPQQIICSTNIIAGISVNAGASMNSPLGSFGVMEAILMTDEINTMIHDMHIHISPKGPTGPPEPGPMI